MMSNENGRRQPLGFLSVQFLRRSACLVFLGCLVTGATAQSAIKPGFDLIPTSQPIATSVLPDIAAVENDIRLSPVLGGGLPIPRLPEKKARVAMPTTGGQLIRIGADGLPLPRAHFDPAILSPARNVQVNAAVPKSKLGNAPQVATGSSAKPAAAAPAAATSKPASVATARATPAPAIKSTATAGVKAPVPLQRSTQPVMAAAPTVSPRASSATATAKALAAAVSPHPIGGSAPVRLGRIENNALALDEDPHAMPEYNLVQLPPQSPPPMPTQSLPAKAQDLDGLQGQALSIKLGGRGWIYTGTGKTPAGVSYIEKSVQTDSEQFRFRLDETGRLVLQFQRQDVASGLLDREDVAVTVRPRTPVSNNNGMRIQASSSEMGGIGSYQPEFPIPQDSSSRLRTGAVSKPTPDAAPAIAAAAQSPAGELNPATLPADAPGLYSVALQRDQLHQSANARLVYEKILKDHPSFDKTDEILFRLGRLLENDPTEKDLRRAYELYVRVQNEFPYSIWVEPARDRSRYLKRTFFQQ